MSGIYIHIPFCKKACHYCDFHFSTSLQYKSEMVDALVTELKLRKHYLPNNKIESIYFGGGTPSLLDASEINRIIDHISQHFDLSASAEITLEANPDDLDNAKVRELRFIPINRFSIGVQSFFDEDLQWMNRSHNASETEDAIKRVQDAGFENITADLIYGYPLLNDDKWRTNIQKMVGLEVPHISCYSMTIEPGTALHHFIKKGETKPLNEQQSAGQFFILMDKLGQAGFDHYEISNFAKPGYQSKHNSSYWKGTSYLGIGPSAHSFNGHQRQWNVDNNMTYLKAINSASIPAAIEDLSINNKFNEYLMTSLRTMWGTDLNHINLHFGEDYAHHVLKRVADLKDHNWFNLKEEKLILTCEGKLFADHVASEFFIVDDE